MPGRAALTSVEGAMSDIRGTRKGENAAGISGTDTSEIGGAGRKGADGNGRLEMAPHHNICDEVVGKPMNGTATGGTTGYDSGFGRTF